MFDFLDLWDVFECNEIFVSRLDDILLHIMSHISCTGSALTCRWTGRLFRFSVFDSRSDLISSITLQDRRNSKEDSAGRLLGKEFFFSRVALESQHFLLPVTLLS